MENLDRQTVGLPFRAKLNFSRENRLEPMNINDLKGVTATQNKPVVLHLADGQVLKVSNSDFIRFPPTESTAQSVIVYREPPASGFQIVDANEVVSVETE